MKAIFIAFILSTFSACSKDDDNNNSTPDNLSVITINSPAAGFTFLNGGTLRVEGEINDLDKVSTARIQIRNKATSSLFYEQTSSAGDITRYFFLWNWTISGISSPQTATITVTSKDARGFEISKVIDVNLIP